jgi:hypothetical protein
MSEVRNGWIPLASLGALDRVHQKLKRYSLAVISRVGMPNSSTYHSPMTILIVGVVA